MDKHMLIIIVATFMIFIVIRPAFASEAPSISNISVSQNFLNGTNTGTAISFTLAGMDDSWVSVEISNSTKVIRNYFLQTKDIDKMSTGGHYTFYWSGYDSFGYLPAEGQYTITVRAFSNNCEFIRDIGKNASPGNTEWSRYAFIFDGPNDIALNSTGFLYVSDGSCYIFNDTNDLIKTINIRGSGIGVGPDDTLISPSNGYKIDRSGTYRKVSGMVETNTIFYDAAVNSTGYVFSMGLARGDGTEKGPFLRLYDPQYNFIRTVASKDIGPAGYNGAMGMAVNSTDYIYVAETANQRLSVFKPDGEFYGFIPTPSSWPYFVAIDSYDNVFVTVNNPDYTILVLTPDGQIEGQFGDLSKLSNFAPAGIAVTGDGRIYVCDIGNHVVKLFYKGVFSRDVKIIVDRTSPQVLAINYNPSANGDSGGMRATATFSEAIDPASINGDTFLLNNGSVEGTVTYDPATLTAFFNPASALQSSTNYNVTLTTGIRDMAGNPLASSFTGGFNTAAHAIPSTTPGPTSAPFATSPSAVPVGYEWLLLTVAGIGLAGLALCRKG